MTFTRSIDLLLGDLTWRVFAYTAEQVQRVLDARLSRPPSAGNLIRRLAREGLVESQTTALTFVEPSEPLWTWNPGRAAPDGAALQWRLDRRWRDARPRRVTLCWATAEAARLFAGLAPFDAHTTQVEHDLGTAGVLVALHETRPGWADRWVGEAVLRRDYGRKAWLKNRPDAAVLESQEVLRFVEFGGQYKADRLRRFHKHCRRFQLPYELW